jgi:flagellar biosynthesis protein FliQ
MLENLLTTSVTESTITLAGVATVTVAAIILGLLISLVYVMTNKNNGYASGFATTLIMLPLIICIIIMLVGNNIARAFSLAGAFSIIRFRSVPGEPRDISYVLFTLAIGLSCGMGYIGYGAIFTLILCTMMVVLEKTNFAKPKGKNMQLKIMVPEDLNYEDAFDDVFMKYTNSWKLEHIKSKDFGALFELCFKISPKENVNKKKFIDELRCRNGNLNIILTMSVSEEKSFG